MRNIIKFIIGVALILIAWLVIGKLLDGVLFIDKFKLFTFRTLTLSLMEANKYLMHLFFNIDLTNGYEIVMFQGRMEPQGYVYLCNNVLYIIGSGCLAHELMFYFAGLIIVIPGPWKHKLWYIPAGIIAIHIMNILRMFGLSITQFYFKEYFDVIHHGVFRMIIYAITFIFWVIWINYYAKDSIIKFAKSVKKTKK